MNAQQSEEKLSAAPEPQSFLTERQELAEQAREPAIPARGEGVVATKIYLALGSNIGDRLANLREACARLERHPALRIEARSRVYETQSVESGGEAAFLNAALRATWNGSATALLRCTQSIEERMGRRAPPRHGPRLIDIDILIFGDRVIQTSELTIPHPRMTQRAFVMRPLCDVLENGWIREFSQGKL